VSVSTPFVAQLRARPETIRLGTAGEPVITVRVQVPEVWDTVRIDAPETTPVIVLKQHALAILMPTAEQAEYVTKFRGFEVLDETAALSAAGVENGSTLLVTSRRRRPVR
jgi:broad specificity phosphatase PhoE